MAALQESIIGYPPDIKYAIELYYSKPHIGNKEIGKLFGKTAPSTIYNIKRIAIEKMAEKGVQRWSKYSIDTEIAYEAWGLDIADLENRYKKLKKLINKEGQHAEILFHLWHRPRISLSRRLERGIRSEYTNRSQYFHGISPEQRGFGMYKLCRLLQRRILC